MVRKPGIGPLHLWHHASRSDHHQAMVGAIQLNGLVDPADQVRTVCGQEGEHGVEAFLEMALEGGIVVPRDAASAGDEAAGGGALRIGGAP